MKKKVYQKPAMQVYSIEPSVILAGSDSGTGSDGNEKHEEKRGQLYDGIPVNKKPYDGDWD